MKLTTLASALVLGTALTAAGVANARDQIRIAGSSTVLPYANIVAEAFGDSYSEFPTPIVESGGSSAGLKEFCRGIGEATIDIANSSRKIREKEVKACADAGVKEITEIRFGYDGIVFASDINGPDFKFTPSDWYTGLAAQLVIDDKLVDNPYNTWNEVNPAFPKWKIAAYIPGEKHGTREVFEDKVLAVGCAETGGKELMAKIGIDAKAAKSACIRVRKDGKAVDIDGDYTETLSRINANKTGIGVFGLAFSENNLDKLKVATMNDVSPSVETISSGEYPVSRPLFFYVKKTHLEVIPGLREYVDFFISDEMTGPASPTSDYGLVAAPRKERDETRSNFSSGKIM